MKWPALVLVCLVAGHGSLAVPQNGPPQPPPLPNLVANLPPGQLPAFLKLLRSAVDRRRATEAPLFAAPSAGLPPVEAAAKAAPVMEAVAEVVPVVKAAAVAPVAEAEVIVVEPKAAPQLDAIALLAKAAGPPTVRLSGAPMAALKSKNRPTAGPPTQAQANEATSPSRPSKGYLPPAETTSAAPPAGESKSAKKVSTSYLPPPTADATGPSGRSGDPAAQHEFSFTFESPDGLIPEEFLKHFAPATEPDAAAGGTSRSTTSTWQTFETYEYQQTAPGFGGTGPSQSDTGPPPSGFSSAPSGFGGSSRGFPLGLSGDFSNIGSGLLGLAGLGGGSTNLDQPAPGPDSLIPVEPQLTRQVENELSLDALALDNPDLNVVEKEFNGATPVVSPAKVGEFIPDAVLFRDPVDAGPASDGRVDVSQQKIIAKEPKLTGGAGPGSTLSSNAPTFGNGLRPSIRTGSHDTTAGGAGQNPLSGGSRNPSPGPHDSSAIGTGHGSPGQTNVFPFRRDGPPKSNFHSNSFVGQPSTTTRPFFTANSFTTTVTPRAFTHTTPSTLSHGTFSHTTPSTSFHNSFRQNPSTNTRGTFSHTTPPTHSHGTFRQTRPASNFPSFSTQSPSTGHRRPFHQNTTPVNTHTTFTQSQVTSSPRTFNNRPTHTFQTTFAQSTTHQRPFTQTTHGVNKQSTFAQTRPATHATFTPTTRPATHFQSSFTRAPTTSPFTHNTQSRFTHARPAANTHTSFSHSQPTTNFQTFTPTRAPTSQGSFRQAGPSPRPQPATFIQINPQHSSRGGSFRQSGSSATSRPKAGPPAQGTSSATRLPNFNDPNFDSYAFYSDLRNLYGTPK